MSHRSDGEVVAPAEHPVRAVVLRGGVPTQPQAAALAAALLTVGSGSDAPAPTPTASGWQRAAMLEGIGERAIAERAELDRPAGFR